MFAPFVRGRNYAPAYYSENDPKASAWLRELIAGDHIAPGEVDERSIKDVSPDDLRGFIQCHFFAGIGVWSYALRRARWPDDKPVWTGSCPCQPFSAAGKGAGFDDERHLWPDWLWHIQNAKQPEVPIFAEQVASKDGLAWLDLVLDDLEGSGHTGWPFDLCAAGFGAPHRRQRLYLVGLANSHQPRSQGRGGVRERADQRLVGAGGVVGGLEHAASHGRVEWGAEPGGWSPATGRGDGRLADAHGGQRRRFTIGEGGLGHGTQAGWDQSDSGAVVGLADSGHGSRQRGEPWPTLGGLSPQFGGDVPGGATGPVNGYWRDADWLGCRDDKWRPVEPGLEPLAHGAPARVVRLRGYGNAINAEQAAHFIQVATEVFDL